MKILGTGCLSLLENIQTIWSFTASFIFFCFYCVSLYIWLYVLYASFNFVYHAFFFLCLFILIVMYVSVLGIVFHCVVKVSTSVVKCSEDLRNMVSIIIRKYTDRMKLYCFFHCLLVLLCFIVYMVVCFICFYLILCIMYSFFYVYLFLLLCMFCSRYCVSLCCSVYCLCVNVYCTTATGCQPNCS